MTDKRREPNRKGSNVPYTERGISRVPCARCGKPSRQQWMVCALDKWLGVCDQCDLDLNYAVLQFMGFPDAEEITIRYSAAMGNYGAPSQ